MTVSFSRPLEALLGWIWVVREVAGRDPQPADRNQVHFKGACPGGPSFPVWWLGDVVGGPQIDVQDQVNL